MLKIDFSSLERILLGIVAFVLSVHNATIEAWYTIDGLFFTSIGLCLCIRKSRVSRFIGYALIGMAYLCKQSFLPISIMSLIILGDWRKIRFWLAAALPGLLYLAYLIYAGALKDAIFQISIQHNILSIIKKYIDQRSMLAGIPWGYLAVCLTAAKLKIGILAKKENLQSLLGILMLYAAPLAAIIVLILNTKVASSSFFLFGATAGATIHFLKEWKGKVRYIQTGLLILLTAFCVSLSITSPYPLLADGPLALLLICYGYISYQPIDKNGYLKRLSLFNGYLSDSGIV